MHSSVSYPKCELGLACAHKDSLFKELTVEFLDERDERSRSSGFEENKLRKQMERDCGLSPVIKPG